MAWIWLISLSFCIVYVLDASLIRVVAGGVDGTFIEVGNALSLNISLLALSSTGGSRARY